MKILLLFILITYSSSLLVFPLKTRENNEEKYKSPINTTKITIAKYVKHILDDYELVSQIEVGIPRQTVEVQFDFDDNYLTLLSHLSSLNSYYYNKSTSYTELYEKDPNCPLQVLNSFTIKEIFYMKNTFHSKLKNFIESKNETSHEFVIIFSKVLPKIVGNNRYSMNSIEIGILINTKYNDEHGIYKPFLNVVKEQGFIENYTHFLYFFDKYKESLYINQENKIYDGVIVFGKYPHEVLPNKYNVNKL